MRLGRRATLSPASSLERVHKLGSGEEEARPTTSAIRRICRPKIGRRQHERGSLKFLLFRLRNGKDSVGLENRYFDLLLVPILICAAASLVALARPRSPFPRLARAAGLGLQGSWLLQMSFSLFTSFVAHGCALRRRSRSNFTVACLGHADIHRGSAIATLQFNLHLAGLLAVAVGLYAILAAKNGGGLRAMAEYRPIGKQLQRLEHVSTSNFTLESDEDEERSMPGKHDAAVSENGFGGAH
ncbi:hypothetical protein KSP40_PGU002303 [Platanthera guangdongensis]|uniref:Uncharacterized protein n=1 Tax=Platanthera guangdongensis TaxID=2320717 RepID=A0ABR2MUL2_9ASPA